MEIDRAIHIVKNRACAKCDSSNSDWNCAECDEALSLALKGFELLKKQKPVKPILSTLCAGSIKVPIFICGHCSMRLAKNAKFCYECGWNVDWSKRNK